MQCKVCGIEYGVAHECSGLGPGVTLEEAAPPPGGIAPGYYLRLAFKIASFDDLSIRRASRDRNAIVYGAALSLTTASIIFLVTALPGMLNRPGRTLGTIFWGLLLGFLYVWIWMGIVAGVQIGICHAVSKVFMEGCGTFSSVARSALLAWFVNFLMVIPRLGLVAALIAWTAVLATVLKNVDGLSRSRAFLVPAGVNAAYYALLLFAQHFQR